MDGPEVYKTFEVATDAAGRKVPPRQVGGGQVEVDLAREGRPRTEKVSQLLARALPAWGRAVEGVYNARLEDRRLADGAQAVASRFYFESRITGFAQRLLPGSGEDEVVRRADDLLEVAFGAGRIQAAEVRAGTTEVQLNEAERQLVDYLYGSPPPPGSPAGAPRVFGPRPAVGSLGEFFWVKFTEGAREFVRKGWAGGGANQVPDGDIKDFLFGITREQIHTLRSRVRAGDIGKALDWEKDGPLAVYGAGIPGRERAAVPVENEADKSIREFKVALVDLMARKVIPDDRRADMAKRYNEAIAHMRALRREEEANIMVAEWHYLTAVSAVIAAGKAGEHDGCFKQGDVSRADIINAITVEGKVDADRVWKKLIKRNVAGGYVRIADIIPSAAGEFGTKNFWDLKLPEVESLRKYVREIVATKVTGTPDEKTSKAMEAEALSVLTLTHRRRFEMEAGEGLTASGNDMQIDHPWVIEDVVYALHMNRAGMEAVRKNKSFAGPLDAVFDKFVQEQRAGGAVGLNAYVNVPDILPNLIEYHDSAGNLKRIAIDYYSDFKDPVSGKSFEDMENDETVHLARGVLAAARIAGHSYVDFSGISGDAGNRAKRWGAIMNVSKRIRGLDEKSKPLSEIATQPGWLNIYFGGVADMLSKLGALQDYRLQATLVVIGLGVDARKSTVRKISPITDDGETARVAGVLARQKLSDAQTGESVSFLNGEPERIFDCSHFPPRLSFMERSALEALLGAKRMATLDETRAKGEKLPRLSRVGIAKRAIDFLDDLLLPPQRQEKK